MRPRPVAADAPERQRPAPTATASPTVPSPKATRRALLDSSPARARRRDFSSAFSALVGRGVSKRKKDA